MLHGVIMPGFKHFEEDHWIDHFLGKCHLDDHPWGCTVHISKELCMCYLAFVDNGILLNSIRMGTIDWTGENHDDDQSTWVM